MTVLRTNLNDTKLDLIGVNTHSNAGEIKSNDESVVRDPKSSKLNAHKMKLVDSITKLTGKNLY